MTHEILAFLYQKSGECHGRQPAIARSAVQRRLQAVGAAVTELFPSAQEPLATPPPGSGLKPVLGNYGFPFLGHLVAAIADPWNSPGALRALRAGLLGRRVGFRVVAVMACRRSKRCGSTRDKAFSSTRGWQPVIGPFFDRGIMLLDFEEHRDHRRIMQQAFTRSCLNGYLRLMSPGHRRNARRVGNRGRTFRFIPW